MAALTPFAAGVLFALVTEPAVSPRSSVGAFSDGIREPCTASSVYAANGRAALIMSSGVVAGGIPSLIGLASFGKDLTAVCIRAFLYGTPVHQIVAAIGPHGLLEVPALLSAGAAGIAGVPSLWFLASGNRAMFRGTITLSIGLAAIALALLAPAAIIECHATPIVIQWAL